MDLWIGTSGFQYPEWKGKFYPEKMPPGKMLPYYAERFTTTEINYSFRQIPSEKSIQSWAGSTPSRFKFSFKAPQKVTHFAKLRNCDETVRFFHVVISALGNKLGCVLFQLPPWIQARHTAPSLVYRRHSERNARRIRIPRRVMVKTKFSMNCGNSTPRFALLKAKAWQARSSLLQILAT
jgi:uncharacterized protein YecE (DUF72 family)